MMKNSATAVLLSVTLAFAAFIGGFYLGRNTGGQTIEISAFSATTAPTSTAAPTPLTSNSTPTGTEAGGTVPIDSPTTSPTQPITFPININTATLEELVLIPYIGPVLAQRILDFRNEIGSFQHIDDLLDVKGIGSKTLDKIREYITL